MLIAADVGTTFQLGPYTVRIGLRADNPAFARYLVFKRDRLVGKQFSRPCLSDCEWLEQWGSEYARGSRNIEEILVGGISATSLDEYRNRGGNSTRKRGRPPKVPLAPDLNEEFAA